MGAVLEVVLRFHTLSVWFPPLHPFGVQSYSVGLFLVRQMTSAELLQRLKTIGIKHPELCKALGKCPSLLSILGWLIIDSTASVGSQGVS